MRAAFGHAFTSDTAATISNLHFHPIAPTAPTAPACQETLSFRTFILSYLFTSYLIKDTRGYHNQPTWISNPSTCHDVTITSLKSRSLEQPRPTTSWHLTSLTSSSFSDSAIRHSLHQFPLVSTITSWHSSRPQESLYGKVTSRH